MTMSLVKPDYSDPAVAAALLQDPSTSASALYQIAQLRPELRPMVAAHPALYPELRQWLAGQHDSAIDEALAGGSAQGMPAMAWPQSGYPVAGVPYGYRPRRNWKKAIIAAVVAGALLLGGGTALATTQHWFGSGGTGGGSGANGLTVTGDAPNASAPKPTFADGYRTIYQPSSPYAGLVTATSKMVVMADPFNSANRAVYGIDRVTGQQVWTRDNQECRGPDVGSFIICRDYVGEYRLADSLQWVDVETGQTMGDLELTSVGTTMYEFQILRSGVLVFAGQTKDTPYNEPVTVGYFTGPGKPTWATTTTGFVGQWIPAIPRTMTEEGEGLIFVNSQYFGTFAFDEKTGATVDLGGYQTQGQILPPRTICFGGMFSTDVKQHAVDVAGAEPVQIRTCESDGEWMVPFTNQVNHPDVLLVDKQDGIAAYSATDFSSPLWVSQGMAGTRVAAAAWDGADTVFALGGSEPQSMTIWAFSLNTGAVIWQTNLPYGTNPRGELIWPVATYIGGALAVWDQSVGVVHFYRVDNGDPIPGLNNMSIVNFSISGDVLVGGNDAEAWVLEPAFSQGQSSALQAPADMPSCPTGMSPVSWTKFDTGSILVCKGATYQVIVDDGAHPKFVPVKLEFNSSGMTITGKDGTVYRCGAGGSVVIVDVKGQSTTHPASMAWTPGSGQVTYQAPPTGIQPCPAGTWPISLSTWNGGWLLICGVDDKTPTWLSFSDGTTSATATTVTSMTVGGYCADTNIGRICVYAAPALVTVTSPNGDVTQYPVTSNFFPNVGAGGNNQGTGAYGVPPPDATAADEARYLEQILMASAQTRANLVTVLNHLENKQCSASDMATLQSVVASRQQQIDAVNGAPVTHLPNGAALVAKLSQALQVSLQADKLYVQWGQAVQAQDWTTAANLETQWQPPAQQSDVLKGEFVEMWNSQIAPIYNVSTFRAEQI